METENEKYIRIVKLLKSSGPKLDSTQDIEAKVLRKIKKMDNSRISFDTLLDYLFGWVYIGWVRRSLITAAVILVVAFVYQQGVILNRIDSLSRQTVIKDTEPLSAPSDNIEKILMLYRKSSRSFPSGSVIISEKQLKDLLESLKEQELRFKDLEDLLEADPELKSLIEKKLLENSHNKINL